ncbi:HalOD1 output domain-containing protein [Haloarchaeobius sp. HRN-SO-5]|uniref:HalOD1 output domain-containing protein n=1 Tax=Haloarchaeobius sp. HRN-SO-5 TaxID=3446118 RepID=UPI003EBD68AD
MHQNTTQSVPQSPPQYQRQEAPSYTVKHDFDGSASLTTTLIHAISDVTGIDVSDTEHTLADVIDPEALDRLFQSKSDDSAFVNGHVHFVLWGCQVTIYSDGHIVVVPPQPQQGYQ